MRRSVKSLEPDRHILTNLRWDCYSPFFFTVEQVAVSSPVDVSPSREVAVSFIWNVPLYQCLAQDMRTGAGVFYLGPS